MEGSPGTPPARWEGQLTITGRLGLLPMRKEREQLLPGLQEHSPKGGRGHKLSALMQRDEGDTEKAALIIKMQETGPGMCYSFGVTHANFSCLTKAHHQRLTPRGKDCPERQTLPGALPSPSSWSHARVHCLAVGSCYASALWKL